MTRHYINDCPCGKQHTPAKGLFILAPSLDDAGVDDEEILDELDRLRRRVRRHDTIAIVYFVAIFVILIFGWLL